MSIDPVSLGAASSALAYGEVSGFRIFDSRQAVEICSTIPVATVKSIILLGYLNPGDSPPCCYRLYSTNGVPPSYPGVTMVGSNQNLPHFYDAAGNVWLIDEPVIDPRWFGAKADYLNFSQQQVAAGSSNQLTFAYNYTTSSLDIGKYFGATMSSGTASPSWKYLRFLVAPTLGDAMLFGKVDYSSQTGTGNGAFVNAYPGCTSTLMTNSLLNWTSANGGTATVTMAAHGLATGDTVLITVNGANPTGYNGTWNGTVASATTITFTLASNPGSFVAAGTSYLTQFVTGTYTVTFTSATTYTVTDPNAYAVGTGSFTSSASGTMSQFTSGKICFLLQAGPTAFVTNDTITMSLSGFMGIFGTAGAGTSSALIANNASVKTLAANVVSWINGITSALTASVTDTNYNEILVQTVATGGSTLTWCTRYSGYLSVIPTTDKYFRGGCFQGDLLAQVTGHSGSALTLNKTTIAQNGVNGGNAIIFSGQVNAVGNLVYVTSVTTGAVQCGINMVNAGLSSYTYIHRQVSGTPGGVGVYATSVNQTTTTGTALQSGFAQSSMGTDNWAPIQNAVNLAYCNAPTQVTNAVPAQTTDLIQANLRTLKVVYRTYNGDGGAFGVLQPIMFGESIDQESIGTGEVCALPGFMAQTGKYQIASLNWSNNTVTVGLSVALGVSSGTLNVNISQCSPSAYNGYWLCTVVNSTTLTYTIPSYTFAITNLQWSAGTATATISGYLPFNPGQQTAVVVTGNTPTGWNGAVTATITSSATFTYPLASNPGNVSVYGSAEVSPGTAATLGQVYALEAPSPNFGGRAAVMMTPLSQSGVNYVGNVPVRGRLHNMRISTYFGWGQRCLWFPQNQYVDVTGTTYFVWNRRGLLVGYNGVSTSNTNQNTLYVEKISGTTTYYISSKIDTENRAVHIDLGSTDNIIEKLLIFHMMVPYEDNGSSNQVYESHCFPGDNLGTYLLGNQYTCGRLYVDSFGVSVLTTLGADPPPAYCAVVGRSATGRINEITFAQNQLSNAGTLNAAQCYVFYGGPVGIPVQVNKIYFAGASFTMNQIMAGPGGSNSGAVTVEVLQPPSYSIGGFYQYFGKFTGVLFNTMLSPTASGSSMTLNPGANVFMVGASARTMSLPANPCYGQVCRLTATTSTLTATVASTDGSLVASATQTSVTLPTGIAAYDFKYTSSGVWHYFAQTGA